MLGDQPVFQSAGPFGVEIRVALGVDQDHLIGVEQALVTLQQYGEIQLALVGEPGAAVGQGVGTQLRGHGQGGAHPLADGFVTGKLGFDVCGLPQGLLLDVGTGLVTAGDKGLALLLDGLQPLGCVVQFAETRRIFRRTDDDEVVVHQVYRLDAKACIDELLLGRGGVGHHQIRVAILAHLQALAGTGRHHLHRITGLFGELGQ